MDKFLTLGKEEAMRNWTPQGIEVCKTKEGTDVM